MTHRDIEPTRVTFPQGATSGTATVLFAVDAPDGGVFVVDETPFHPIDHTWPDQPGDVGTVSVTGRECAIVDTAMAALSEDGTFAIGPAIPVKRGTEGWTWLVAHRLSTPGVPTWLAAGTEVTLDVDVEARAALSRGHSGCHLAALALNEVLAPLWRKPTPTDSFGAPNFDAKANATSVIVPGGSVDEYRLGKSLRKAGFDTETLANELDRITSEVNAVLERWIEQDAPSCIDVEGPSITDRRTWVCDLEHGSASILCGGTHVDRLATLGTVRVALTMPDEQQLVMTTATA